MRSAPEQVYNDPPEVLVAFDLSVDGAGAELNDVLATLGAPKPEWSVLELTESFWWGMQAERGG
jgi:hypothetical protein